MAGRRLTELLEEQQEPFLLHQEARKAAQQCRSIAGAHRRHRVYVSENGDAAAGRRSALGRAARRAVRLAGCFSCGARESFRRLPRVRSTGGSHCYDDDDGGRWLSPVSVLDVLRHFSDEESSSHALSSWEEEEDNDKPSSTSRRSPPSDLLAAGATNPPTTPHTADDWTRTRSAEEAPKGGSGKKKSTEEQKIISSWERLAGDIARVPVLAQLDLYSTGSAPEWRRIGLGEAAWVGTSIEAMIFEEVRVEAVRDMLNLIG